MQRTLFIFAGLVAFIWADRAAAAPQSPLTGRVVDRIVERIEGDIVLQSQVRELSAFQQLIDGHAESDEKVLAELTEQWMVQTEATASHFPEPAKSEVDRELARLSAQFATPAAYSSKLRELGISEGQVRQMLARQIYIERYLDYKFRPSVLVEPADIDAYYRKELVPELAKTNQPAPNRADVEDQIREVLVQRRISDLAAKWLDETRSRLKIEPAIPAVTGDVKVAPDAEAKPGK
jgi:hypothetical protein